MGNAWFRPAPSRGRYGCQFGLGGSVIVSSFMEGFYSNEKKASLCFTRPTWMNLGVLGVGHRG